MNLSGASGGTISDSQGVGTILNDDSGGKGGSKGSSKTLTASAVDAAMTEADERSTEETQPVA